MRTLALLIAAIGASGYVSVAQQIPVGQQTEDSVSISREAARVTVNVIDSRPLAGAIVAIRREYGWRVDYEDPVYLPSQLVDATPPGWRAMHPEKKGGYIPGGTSLRTTYNEDFAGHAATDEQKSDTINQVLADFQRSQNPGTFVLRKLSGRLDVVGVTDGKAVLDAPITFKATNVTAIHVLEEIMTQVGQQTGLDAGLGFVPMNALIHCTVDPSYNSVPARDAILDVLQKCHLDVTWEALWGGNRNSYLLNLDAVARVYKDQTGKTLVLPPQP